MLAACSKPAQQPSGQLLVASASDMVRALPELAKDFEARNHVKVVPTFGPSGSLAQQIVHGAPFDVFLSADQDKVRMLVESKQVNGASRRVYALGKLVLLAPSVRLGDLSELRLKEIRRFSIANPDIAPYGLAAKQALQRAGVWDDVQSKVVIAENVREALEMAESGNVDATLTAMALISGPSPAGGAQLPETRLPVPQHFYDGIQQSAGVIIRPGASPHAQEFLDYLGSPSARQILQRYGFGLPD